MQPANNVRIHELSHVVSYTDMRLLRKKVAIKNPKQDNSVPLSDLTVTQGSTAEVDFGNQQR